MSLVYVFLADGFEEVEGLTAVDLLRRAECQAIMVSITGSRTITGSHGIRVEADMLFDEVDQEAEMLVLPGGMPGTLHLKEHEGLAALLRSQYDHKGWIAAICAAPSVLEGLGFLKDRQATSYPGSIGEATGTYMEQPVVVDEHVITSRGVGTAIPFALKLIELLKGGEMSDKIASSIIFR
ncbi:MAG: DJ-1/PfpI family protein [Eubacterium sp.]|nr:DJ-1/PfpI family protein [Eubacterium sp.]